MIPSIPWIPWIPKTLTPLQFNERLEYLGLLISSEHIIAVDCWYPWNSFKSLEFLIFCKTLRILKCSKRLELLDFSFFLQNYHGSQSPEMLLSAFRCFEGLESLKGLEFPKRLKGLESVEGFECLECLEGLKYFEG